MTQKNHKSKQSVNAGSSQNLYFRRYHDTKRCRSRFAAVLMVIVLLMSTAAAVYAESYSMRNGQINMELPESWNAMEYDVGVDEFSDGWAEQIFEADNGTGITGELYYIAQRAEYLEYEESLPYLYMDSEDDLQTYYEDYGENVLNDFYQEYLEQDLTLSAEPKYYANDWIHYLELEATAAVSDGGKETRQLIYLTAQADMVHKIFIFQDPGVKSDYAALRKAAQPIMDSFYDYGYDEEMVGEHADSSNSVFPLDGDWMSQVVPIIVVILVIIISYNKAKQNKSGRKRSAIPKAARTQKKSESMGMPDQRKHADWKDLIKPQNLNPKNTKSQSPKKRSARQAGEGAGHAHMQGEGFTRKNDGKSERSARTNTLSEAGKKRQYRPAQSSLESYDECLKTLMKSGLVTRAEYNELLEKHGMK